MSGTKKGSAKGGKPAAGKGGGTGGPGAAVIPSRGRGEVSYKPEAESQAGTGAVPRMQQRLVELSPRWRQVLDYRAIGLNNKEIGKLLNLSQRSVSRTLQEMAAYGIVIGDSPARRRKTLAPQWRRCAAAGLQLPLFPPEVTQ